MFIFNKKCLLNILKSNSFTVIIFLLLNWANKYVQTCLLQILVTTDLQRKKHKRRKICQWNDMLTFLKENKRNRIYFIFWLMFEIQIHFCNQLFLFLDVGISFLECLTFKNILVKPSCQFPFSWVSKLDLESVCRLGCLLSSHH